MTRHLVIAGVQRCGTTSLVRLLSELPGVVTSERAIPEPKVLLGDAPPLDTGSYERALLGRVAPEASVVVEKTTSYLEAAGLPARLVATLPDAHVAVVLRDPVLRAVSHHRFSTSHGLEWRPLLEALEADLRGEHPDAPASVSMDPFAYVRRGRYAEALEPWVEVLGAERVHVLVLEHLRASPTDGAGATTDGAGATVEPRLATMLGALGLPLAPVPALGTANAGPSGTAPDADLAAARRLLAPVLEPSIRLLEARFGLDLTTWRPPGLATSSGAPAQGVADDPPLGRVGPGTSP